MIIIEDIQCSNWLRPLWMLSYEFDSINSALMIVSSEQIDRDSFSICSSDFLSINIIRSKSKDAVGIFVCSTLFIQCLVFRSDRSTTRHFVSLFVVQMRNGSTWTNWNCVAPHSTFVFPLHWEHRAWLCLSNGLIDGLKWMCTHLQA